MRLVLLFGAALFAVAGSCGPADELAVRFQMKLSALPATVQPSSRFVLAADESGRLTLKLFALPIDLLGDFTVTSKERVKPGEWHQVAFSYSLQQSRVCFYLDGRLQWENDNVSIPKLKRTGPLVAERNAEVREYTEYPFAALRDQLTFAGLDDIARWGAKAKEVAESVRGGLRERALEHAGYFAYFRSETEKAGYGTFPLKRLEDEVQFIENCARVTNGTDLAHFDPFVEQTPVTPERLPESADFDRRVNLVACPGEQEGLALLAVSELPVKDATLTVSDFTGDGAVLPAASIDRKIVKRWWRSGGAWLYYFNDRRGRFLVPDLLLNDDKLIRVDEQTKRNYLRMEYPDGTVYVDVGETAKGHVAWDRFMDENAPIPFRDAKTLQPFDLEGDLRNVMLLVTFKVPAGQKPGLYRGTITLKAGRITVGKTVSLKVLPIRLPIEGSPYAKLDDVYVTHMNSFPDSPLRGLTRKDREDFARRTLRNIREHNMFHTTGIWSKPEYVKLAKEVGFIPDKIFGNPDCVAKEFGCWYKVCWDLFFAGVPFGELTVADREKGKLAVRRALEPWTKYMSDNGLSKGVQYEIFWSESQHYERIVRDQAELGETPREMGMKIFAHGFSPNQWWSTDVQDMQSSISINPVEARRWHASGDELINYCDPFPSAENPVKMRRKPGLWMYKTGLDGQMMHGFATSRCPWIEWAEDYGGDGSYRNFCMAYASADDNLYTLAWDGMREAYDDVRYFTRLKQLGTFNLEAKDVFLRREAKRALQWLDRLDPRTTDLTYAKVGCLERILILQEAIAKHGGVLPDADMNLAKYR